MMSFLASLRDFLYSHARPCNWFTREKLILQTTLTTTSVSGPGKLEAAIYVTSIVFCFLLLRPRKKKCHRVPTVPLRSCCGHVFLRVRGLKIRANRCRNKECITMGHSAVFVSYVRVLTISILLMCLLAEEFSAQPKGLSDRQIANSLGTFDFHHKSKWWI